MKKRLNELKGQAAKLTSFSVEDKLCEVKAANGNFPAFKEAETVIDDLLKREVSVLEAKYAINQIIETQYDEAFYEGVLLSAK